MEAKQQATRYPIEVATSIVRPDHWCTAWFRSGFGVSAYVSCAQWRSGCTCSGASWSCKVVAALCTAALISSSVASGIATPGNKLSTRAWNLQCQGTAVVYAEPAVPRDSSCYTPHRQWGLFKGTQAAVRQACIPKRQMSRLLIAVSHDCFLQFTPVGIIECQLRHGCQLYSPDDDLSL